MKDSDIRTTRDRPGWLVPYLMALDQMFFNRWEYWMNAVIDDKIPGAPIPYIRFQSDASCYANMARKNIEKCLNYAMHSHSNIFEKFINWILWGFNYKNNLKFPSIDEKTDDHWYRTFNLGLFYEEPGDHFANVASDYQIGSGSGYFPTPPSVVEMMTKMTFGGEPEPEHKNKSVIDPCCGTGVMLLYASNYSLNLHGIDIHPLICKIAMVNAYIYVPWLVYKPKEITMFNDQESIVEMELPTGIKIPKCSTCGNCKDFLLDVQTDCVIKMNKAGLAEISRPTISQDIVNKKLAPENISCAKCFIETKKEVM